MLNIVGNVILALLLLRLHPILLASAHLTPGSKVLRGTSWSHHPLNRGTWWLLSTSPDTLLDKRSSPILRSNHLTSISSLATKTRVLYHPPCSTRTSYHWPWHWTPRSKHLRPHHLTILHGTLWPQLYWNNLLRRLDSVSHWSSYLLWL